MEQYILNTGSKLVLSLSISGGSTISYQWYHNDIKITGETNPTYTVNNVQIVNGGEYYCKIQDQIYSITSIKFLVLVIQKLEIISQPSTYSKTLGSFVIFDVKVTGNLPLKYKWFKIINGNNIEQYGQITEYFYINEITANDAGDYFVQITDNQNNSINSEICTLNVNNPVQIITQPESSIVNAGEPKILSVKIDGGTAPYTYTWYIDGFKIYTTTNSYSKINTYNIDSFNEINQGVYYVTITDSSYIGATSNEWIMTIYIPIEIISQPPETIIITENSNYNLSVKINDIPPLGYSWYKNDVFIEDATNETYAISNANSIDSGFYYVKIKVANNTYIKSNITNLIVDYNPIIVSQSSSQEKTEGSYVSLFVKTQLDTNFINGLIYKWYFNNSQIIGQNNNVYHINDLTKSDAGVYYVEITNLTGNVVKSENIVLKINSAPSIKLLSDANINITDMDSINILTDIQDGTGPYHLMWFKSSNLANYSLNNNNKNFYKTNIDANIDSGIYFLVVKDSSNIYAFSETVSVNILTNLSIINQPRSQITITSNDVIFNVTNKGYRPFSYQWYYKSNINNNIVAIVGANSPTYKIQWVNGDEAGDYWVNISSNNNEEIVTSDIATLTVYDLPFIQQQPISQKVYKNTDVTFNVIAYGINLYRYQWYFNNIPIMNSDNSYYTISNVNYSNEGNYYVVFTDQQKNRLTSDFASLQIDEFICFKENSKILTNKGYIPIQNLQNGDLVRTLNNGFKPICMIASKKIYHKPIKTRIKEQLYKCSNNNFPEVFEDLIITGGHSILVDRFTNENQKEKVCKLFGKIYVTDSKYRLPACIDERTAIYDYQGDEKIYHFALENDDYYGNYGIYANGLLVETCSKRYLKELSKMDFILS